jgi:PAS domain S-box-containing protein
LTSTQPSERSQAANAVDVALGSTGRPKTLVRARKRDVDYSNESAGSKQLEMPMSNTIDFERLVEAAGDAIIAADPDGNILSWNPAAERIFGFAAQEALGQSLDLIIPERFRARHWDGYKQVMRTGQTKYGADVLRVPARHKDGRPLSIAFTVALLSRADGQTEAIAAIVRDDTSRWNEERSMRERLRKLEEQQSK